MISPSSIAAGNAAYLQNANFKPAVKRLDRKPILFGTFDPAKTGITANKIYSVKNPSHCGSIMGFGFQIHRMVMSFWKNWKGGEIDVIPLTETSANAAGEISYTGTATETRQLDLYISGDHVPVSVIKGMTGAQVATAVVAAISANKDLPVTAVVNGSVTTQVDLTAKSKGVQGNGITIKHNLYPNEAIPAGITAAVTDMSSGAGIPVLTDALVELGEGVLQNENYYTGGASGGGIADTDGLDAISVYNGIGDEEIGNHDGENGRFFHFFNGDNRPSDELDDLQTISALRKDDRTNSVLWVPGSPNHPVEIACALLGVSESEAMSKPESRCEDKILVGILPGSKTETFTGKNTDFDLQCVKQGISTTIKSGMSVKLLDVVTFYRPDSVSFESNIWHSIRNQKVSQNIVYNTKTRFGLERWKNITIVANKAAVTDAIAKLKAREKSDVIAELMDLADDFQKLGWLYDKNHTINLLKESPDDYVQLRAGGKGFNYLLPVVYSGEGGITSGVILADSNVLAAVA